MLVYKCVCSKKGRTDFDDSNFLDGVFIKFFVIKWKRKIWYSLGKKYVEIFYLQRPDISVNDFFKILIKKNILQVG